MSQQMFTDRKKSLFVGYYPGKQLKISSDIIFFFNKGNPNEYEDCLKMLQTKSCNMII